MLQKIKALWNLFRAGESVSDPEKWKKGSVTTTMVAGVLIALVQLAKAFGVDIPLDSETATIIAAGIISFVNVVVTYISSRKIGLLPAKQTLPELQQAASPEGAQDALQDVPEAEVGNAGISDDSRARALEWAKQQRQYEEIDPNSKSGG